MWIEVFKGGEQTDSSGSSHDWTEEELDLIVNKYNDQPEEEQHRAPVVIGHPTDASPAFAWVKELKRDGDVISAFITDIVDEFKEWVNKGLYRERSIALDEDYLLVHLGFLGGVPPAVKGLKPVRFNESKSVRSYSLLVPEAGTAATPAAAATAATTITDTIAQAQAAQVARSAAYGIRIQENGNMIKPTAFADLTDEQFADPVNYRWPISSEAQLLASKSTVNFWDNQYNETERIVIQTRIIEAAKAFGIDTKNWYFNSGTKTRSWALDGAQPTTYQVHQMDNILTGLVDWLRSTYNEETAQQTQAQIDSLTESMKTQLAEWLTSTFGEEVGTAATNKMTELATASSEPAGTEDPAATAASAAGAPATTTPAVSAAHAAGKDVKELHARIEKLEAEKRRAEFAAFCDARIQEGRMIPANREVVIDQLENAFRSDNQGVTTDSLKKTMEFMEKMPKVVPTGTVATQGAASTFSRKSAMNPGPGATVDPDSIKRREKIEAYAEKHGLTYTAAFNQLKAKGDL